MFEKRFARSIALTVIGALVIASAAFADQIQADTDALIASAPHANVLAANQQAGTTVAYDLSAKIVNTGNSSNDVFAAAGDSVTATIARSGDWLAVSVGSPASFNFTAYEVGQAGTIAVTVPCDAAAGVSKAMQALLTPVASNAKIFNPASVTVTYTITASTPADPSCTPADSTAPNISCAVPDQTTWYGSNVTVLCTATDSDSSPAVPASFSLSTSVADGNETASAATGTQVVCDSASAPNCVTAGPYTFKVDRAAPAVSCGSADSIWHATNQSVSCTATDGGSGLADSGDASFSLNTSVAAGSETASASTDSRNVADAVGNSSLAGPIGPFKIDRAAPVVSCGSADSAWHATNQSVACTATDGGSGLADSGDASFSLSTAVADGSETASASTDSRNVADAVGNSSLAGPIGPFKIDRAAPVVSCGSADSAWHALNQIVSCTASDGGSGLADAGDASFSLSTTVADGSETPGAYTGSYDVYDNVGHSSTAGPVGPFKIDLKAPAISCDSADSIWHATNQSVACTASDGGSGLADAGDASFSLSTTVADGDQTASAYTGSHDVYDNVGHSTTAGPVGPFKVDRQGPAITITTPPSGAIYLLNQVVNAIYSCSDGVGSGLASCFGDSSPINTSSVGMHQFTVDALDNVSNASSLTHTYYVHYNWTGFFTPVDNQPVLNVVKAGQSIPMKFSLGGYQGMGIIVAGYPSSNAMTCDSTADLDTIEIVATAGSSGLNYDSTTNQYNFIWKTDKSWANSCRQFILKLDDGTYHRANFKFTR
jgi:hypothetical protein